MISRASALAIAAAYKNRFTSSTRSGHGNTSEKVLRNEVYDFLFENEYEAWFCNLAKAPIHIREFKEFWMRLHTGESLVSATKDWNWVQRQKLGQRLLHNLARDHLQWLEKARQFPYFAKSYTEQFEALRGQLELDGYIFRDGELLQPTADVLDVEAERSAIHALYTKAKLGRREDAFEFLRLTEEHFLAQRWSDCIANVRKFFELTLQEGARALSATGSPLSDTQLAKPVEVRLFFENAGLVERKERELVDKLYGLLSETGAHPYMAESDQARLLRQLALTVSQFFLLRLGTALSSGTSAA